MKMMEIYVESLTKEERMSLLKALKDVIERDDKSMKISVMQSESLESGPVKIHGKGEKKNGDETS